MNIFKGGFLNSMGAEIRDLNEQPRDLFYSKRYLKGVFSPIEPCFTPEQGIESCEVFPFRISMFFLSSV
jgi:hypothetical protein